jgi:predicted O-methyltransferase YrrM
MDKLHSIIGALECYANSRSGNFNFAAKTLYSEQCKLIGWCPPELMVLLNDAVSLMPVGEQYLEVGTYCGRSLTAALRNNDKRAHVVDPMNLRTGKGDIINLWTEGVTRLGVMDRVTLHRLRSEHFNEPLPSIGVFFYDGNHDSGHTYEALNQYKQYLADQALIIVDDYNIAGGIEQNVFPGHELDVGSPVKTDVDCWVDQNREQVKLVIHTPWLNGQAIILYQK